MVIHKPVMFQKAIKTCQSRGIESSSDYMQDILNAWRNLSPTQFKNLVGRHTCHRVTYIPPTLGCQPPRHFPSKISKKLNIPSPRGRQFILTFSHSHVQWTWLIKFETTGTPILLNGTNVVVHTRLIFIALYRQISLETGIQSRG